MSAHPEIAARPCTTTPVGGFAVAARGGKRRNAGRDLSKAITLRPKDVFILYGIPDSTLCVWCKSPDVSKRPPSILVPGRKGRRGVRLFNKDAFERWLEQHRC